MSTKPEESGNPRRKWVSEALEILENDLRKLASEKQTKRYLLVGEALTKAEPVYHGLGTIGFLSEGDELRAHKVRVLESVAPLVMPHLREGKPSHACEVLAKLGVQTANIPKSKKAATATFVANTLAMADKAAKVRSYLSNREEAIKWGILNYSVPDEKPPRNGDGGGAPKAMPFYGVIDPVEIAEIAVRTAKRIQCAPYIMGELTDADPWPNVQIARERLDPGRISVNFGSVALYIERNWTPDHAKKIMGQIFKVIDTLENFLQTYEAVVTKHSCDKFEWKRQDNGSFFVLCTAVANEIAQWAADIRERAGRQRLSPQPEVIGQKSAYKAWAAPSGYVGRKTICTHVRFQKGGKNPAASTIDVWVKASIKAGNPVKIQQAPDSRENHYPEDWIFAQIQTWNPRQQKRNRPT